MEFNLLLLSMGMQRFHCYFRYVSHNLHLQLPVEQRLLPIPLSNVKTSFATNYYVVIGTSNNILLAIGGDVSITSLPLGAFFLGSALISCGITEPLFRRAGRRNGFIVGIVLGIVATVLGAISLLAQSPAINIISTFFFGAANGIGYFIRFAVIENVPTEWASRAVTLVVSGGVIAAFAGPEAGQATRGMITNDKHDPLYYMGVFVMAGVFNVVNLIFISVVRFMPLSDPEAAVSSKSFLDVHKMLLATRSFLVPMIRATMGWSIMAVPMSVLRIAMLDAGFTSRQSLLAIELHFCGMYAPGFITGNLIHRYGARVISCVGWIVSCVAVTVLLTSKTNMNGSVASWIIGMMLLGVGWNFQFTGTTVWLNQAVNDTSCSKGQIQSTNDFLMFLISGAWIFGASFVYDAAFWGNGVLRGWKTLNFCVIGFLVVDVMVIIVDFYFQRLCRQKSLTSKNAAVAREGDDNAAPEH
jgi:MFS family permease